MRWIGIPLRAGYSSMVAASLSDRVMCSAVTDAAIDGADQYIEMGSL